MRHRHQPGGMVSPPPPHPQVPTVTSAEGGPQRARAGVLTPLQGGQLQVLQGQLVQDALHAGLARALQRGVSLGQGKRGSRWAPGPGEGGRARSFWTDSQTGNHLQVCRDVPSSNHPRPAERVGRRPLPSDRGRGEGSHSRVRKPSAFTVTPSCPRWGRRNGVSSSINTRQVCAPRRLPVWLCLVL